jgi:para-nitrobenzyl esterase
VAGRPCDTAHCVHCIDLPLLFDTEAWCDAPMLGGHKVDEGFAEALRRSWVSFAYDGCVSLDSDELHIG